MKVSIIVPVYNVENYLYTCLDSLILQTYENLDIILVDDGSTDSSGEICDIYSKRDSRIRVIHKTNGGQSSARNVGLNVADGEYVLFVDSDDYITENAVEVFVEKAAQGKPDILQGDILNDKERMKNPDFRRIEHENKICATKVFLAEKLSTETYDIVPFLYFVKREYLIRSGLQFHEGVFYEDQLWTLQLLTGSGTVMKIRHPFYYYRMDRPGSTTNSMYLKKGLDAACICNLMYRYLMSNTTINKEYGSLALLISLYQFVSVWRRLNHADRKQVSQKIMDETFELVFTYTEGYKPLRCEVRKYYQNRFLYAVKWDLKKYLIKLKDRSKCIK